MLLAMLDDLLLCVQGCMRTMVFEDPTRGLLETSIASATAAEVPHQCHYCLHTCAQYAAKRVQEVVLVVLDVCTASTTVPTMMHSSVRNRVPVCCVH
jgi:hypothetical protein